MRNQARAKGLGDLKDRFGSGSQVACRSTGYPVMMWYILPVHEESSNSAIPGSLFLHLFKGKAWMRLIRELLLASMGKMEKFNGGPIEWGCLGPIQDQGQHKAKLKLSPIGSARVKQQRH